MKTLDTLYYDDIHDICNDVNLLVEEFDSIGSDVSIVAKYDLARDIIQELICSGFYMEWMQLIPSGFGEYTDEYMITIDYHKNIFCEPLKGENGYYDITTEYTYIHSDCSSKVISHIESPVSFAFEIGECDDEDGDDDCCGEYDECDCKTLDGVDPSYLFDDSDLNPGEYLGSILHDDDPCDTKFLCLILDKDDCVSGFKFVDFDEESYRITSSTTRSSDFEYLVDMIGKLFE